METNKTNLSNLSNLDLSLFSYNRLIILIIIFIVVMFILFVTNRSGFNKYFGYQTLLITPLILLISFLIKELFIFKNNPSASRFSFLPQTNGSTILLSSIISISIIAFMMMLYIGGIFSDSPPENNISTIINFIILVIFFIISITTYLNSKAKDNQILQSLPKELQDVFALRTKYTMMFVMFIFAIMSLYFLNPGGIMTNYGGPVIFFTLFVGIIMVIMITIYQFLLANPSKVNLLSDTPGPFVFVIKALYILASLGISFGLIYGTLKMMGVFNQDASNSDSWGHIIFNLILFSAMLGIIYKLLNAGGFLDKNPYYRLVLNTILYIPCLLVGIFSKVDTTSVTKPYEYKVLVTSLFLLIGYFAWTLYIKHFIQGKYLKQGGLQLINQPISTNILTNVATYQKLSGNDKLKYQYAMSFWCYLDAFSTKSDKFYNLLSYGDNPAIKYNSANNTMYITIKETNKNKNNLKELDTKMMSEWSHIKDKIEEVKLLPVDNEYDTDGHRILYKQSNVKLQKWNHILLNYNGGTLDVFINGELVQSAIEVVPYMNMDMLTTGEENGINGSIANLMYFKEPLDILTINTLYLSLKDKNPPVIPENNEKLV